MNTQYTRSLKCRLLYIIALFLLPPSLWPGAIAAGAASEEQDAITIAMEATAVNTLIYIAHKQNFFSDNGIRIIIKDHYPSGAAATEAMLSGEADLSTTAEFAIVRYAFAGRKISTLGSIDRFMHMKLIARADGGIITPKDFSGKKIGVAVGTAAEFNLGRFLDLQGLDKDSVIVEEVQAPDAVEAMTKGRVDALVTWQPYVLDISNTMGDAIQIWDVQSGQPMYCVLITSRKWSAAHPELKKKFMNSLLQAEQFLIENETQAQEIMQEFLGYDAEDIGTIWHQHRFSLRLDQSLILALEDQARWMQKNILYTAKSIPNFLEYIDTEGLEAVKPEAVSIIR